MRIPIVLATNENYAGPTAATIKSIILNRNKNDEYVFHILHTDLSEHIQSLYKRMKEKNVSINCVDIREHIERIKDLECRYLTKETLYRLFIPEIFPMYDKVIYIDGDTIVLSDIAELYMTDVAGYVLAAAVDGPNVLSVSHYAELMDSTPDENFCAGVLVMNIREFDCSIRDRCIELLLEDSRLEKRKMVYMDQDALNVTCQGRVKKLDLVWNYQVSFVGEEVYDLLLPEYRHMYEEARGKARILHFSGERKPWLYPDLSYSDVFWKYADQTPFRKVIRGKQKEAELEALKETFPLCMIELRSRVAIYGAGFQGKLLYDTLKDTGFAEVALWVDKNFADKEKSVKAVEALKNAEFDRVIIAIENETCAKQAYDTLTAMGIGEEKIKWEFEQKTQ